MERILVIGYPGGGKTAFANKKIVILHNSEEVPRFFENIIDGSVFPPSCYTL